MRRFDLVAFDVDGTLILHPENKTVWEVFNRAFTGDDGVNVERYADYKAGRLSYADWVTLDCEGWRKAGATRERMIGHLDQLTLIEGARETLASLKDAGHRLLVISGTLDLLLEQMLPGAPFDEVYCNRIQFNEDGTIHSWIPTPFDMQGKAKVLRAAAMRERIPLARCAFVGDSSNDVWIAKDAGFSVAFNCKSDKLAEVSDVVVEGDDLRAVLPALLESG